MSHDPHHELVQTHAAHSGTAVVGHGGDTSYEASDAKVGLIVGSLVVIVTTLVISFILVVPIFRILSTVNPPGQLPSPIAPARVVPEKPVLQVHPWNEYPEKLAAWDKQLHNYGKNVAGQPHIPIEQAIDVVASQLNVRPNAPEGYTVPGGQGRDFSKSLADMPAPYRQPQPQEAAAAKPTAIIQGEIRKNAQK